MSSEQQEGKNMSDHDAVTTLIAVVGNLDAKFSDKFAELKADIKEIKDGISSRVSILEQSKADRKELEIVQNIINSDVSIRIVALEKESIIKKQMLQDNKRYLKIILALSAITATVLFYHLTGIKI